MGEDPQRSFLHGQVLRAHPDPASTGDYAVRQRLKIVQQADTIVPLRPIDDPEAEAVTSVCGSLATAHSFFTTLYEPKPTPADQDGKGPRLRH